MPTAAERASGYTNFSDLIATAIREPDGRAGRVLILWEPYSILLPLGRLAATNTFAILFAGNIIPASRLDPNAVKLLNLYPAPTQAGLFNNFSVNRNSTTDVNAFDVRIDQYFSSKGSGFRPL